MERKVYLIETTTRPDKNSPTGERVGYTYYYHPGPVTPHNDTQSLVDINDIAAGMED